LNHHAKLHSVTDFLESAGVEPLRAHDQQENEEELGEVVEEEDAMEVENLPDNDSAGGSDVVIISSDDDDDDDENDSAARRQTKPTAKMEEDEQFDPSQFGNVVDMSFLQVDSNDDVDSIDDEPPQPAARHRRQRNRQVADDEEDNEGQVLPPAAAGLRDDSSSYMGDQSEADSFVRPAKRRRRKAALKRDKYSRDPRYYPSRENVAGLDEDWYYDTESDLVNVNSTQQQEDGDDRKPAASNGTEQDNEDQED
jgi:hypothetical protein